MGLQGELGPYWPLALGAYEQTLLDMTTAYATVTNRGVYVAPTPFLTITGPDGEELWNSERDGRPGRRVLDTQVADTMAWMLQDVVKSGTGIAAQLPDQRPVAGKTGTSQMNRDLWFIGSIPQLTTGVWYGYDDERDTKQLSGEAAWTWKQFMLPIVTTLPKQDFPPLPAPMMQRMKRQEMQNLKILPQGNLEPPPLTAPGQDPSAAPLGSQPQDSQTNPNGDDGDVGTPQGGAAGLPSLPPSQQLPPLRPLNPETNEFDLGEIPPFQG